MSLPLLLVFGMLVGLLSAGGVCLAICSLSPPKGRTFYRGPEITSECVSSAQHGIGRLDRVGMPCDACDSPGV